MLLEYSIIAGLLFGIFYALMAVGLNVVFGVQRIVNLAHGDVVMLGGFAAWEVYYGLHWSPLAAIAIAIPLAVAVGYVVFLAIAPRLGRSSDPEMLSLVLFFGISQAFEALATLGFGADQRGLPNSALGGSAPIAILGQRVPSAWVISAAVALPLLAALFIYLYRTPLGTATRAVMANEEEAAAVGIAVRRVSALSFGIGLAMAAAAGVLGIFMFAGVDPAEGANLTVISFAIIVLGSLGNPVGTVAGGVIYGVAYELAQTYLAGWADLVPYVMLLAVILTRPSGLLGRSNRYA